MRMKFRTYSENVLPKGFIYPKEYIELSQNLDVINQIPYFPWWFEDGNDSDMISYSRSLENLTGMPNLIAFARDGDWAACFDLNDHSGNPKVYVYDLGNRRNHYVSDNFRQWLEDVIQEALAD